MKKIGIFANDYGGAFNSIIYLKKNFKLNKNFYFFLFGPAKDARRLICTKIKIEKNFSKLKRCDFVYYSLSKNKKFEKKFLSIVEKKKINNVLIIDGWGDYKKKMTIRKKLFFPNEIIVFDKFAQSIFFKLFPQKKKYLTLKNNLIFDYIISRKKIKKKSSNNLLYLTSPIHELKKNENVLLKKISTKLDLKLKIRKHPFNQKKKNINIIDDLNLSKVVVGHDSSALIYSSILNKKTYSIGKKDVFNWKKYGTYKFFNIRKISSFKDLNDEINR